MIQGTETFIEHGPVDQGRQPHQLMGHVDLVVKTAAEQFSLVLIPGWLRLHFLPFKLQDNDAQLYRLWQFRTRHSHKNNQ